MFAPFCEKHGSTVLLPMSAITALENKPDGLVAHFTCYCGNKGTWCGHEGSWNTRVATV